MQWMFFSPMAITFAVFCAAMMFFMMRGGMAHRQRDAIDILKERFARGEINQAEFEPRRHLMQS